MMIFATPFTSISFLVRFPPLFLCAFRSLFGILISSVGPCFRSSVLTEEILWTFEVGSGDARIRERVREKEREGAEERERERERESESFYGHAVCL
mmetsp:Transcript_11474/g.22109  ORF Transcript_11474/g.22109 Transcript_11474/m.22109 type:complete len:96 (-) Transcript_11474:364-651(-)